MSMCVYVRLFLGVCGCVCVGACVHVLGRVERCKIGSFSGF